MMRILTKKCPTLPFLILAIFASSASNASPTIGPIQTIPRNKIANQATPIPNAYSDTPLAALARKSMIATLLNESKELRRIAALAERIEASNSDSNNTVTPISRKLALLDTWTNQDPAQRALLLQRIQATQPSHSVRRQTEHALRTQPQSEIKRLRQEDRYNRIATLTNYFVDLGAGIIAGNPQRIFRLVTDFLLLPETWSEISTHNRKAINIYRRNRYRIPATAKNQNLARYIDKLEKRKKDKQATELINRGKWHSKNQRWAAARNSFAYALELDPTNKKTAQLRLQAARNLSAEYRQRHQPRPETISGQDKHTHTRTREDALNILVQSSAPKADTNALQKKLQQTDKRRRHDLWQYILIGDTLDEQARPPSTKRGKTHRFIDSLSLLLPFEWIIRSIQVQYGQPVPDPAWRDAACRYLRIRSTQKSMTEQDTELANRLSASYEKQLRFDKALHFRSIASISLEQSERDKFLEKTRKGYDEKIARHLWREARKQTDPFLKSQLTQYISTRFKNTKAAKQALKKQHQDQPQQSPSLQITRQELIEWPELWLGQGIDLAPEWFDGSADNGEITSAGIYLYGETGQRINFNLKWRKGKKKSIERLSDNATQLLLAPHLRAWKQETAARQRANRILNLRKIPIDLEGAAGPSGFELAPHLVPHTFDQQTLPLYTTPESIRR